MNKDNIKKSIKPSVIHQKPYSKNHIKAKIKQDINPINKGLNLIDQNNNCLKTSKNEKENPKKQILKRFVMFSPMDKVRQNYSSLVETTITLLPL